MIACGGDSDDDPTATAASGTEPASATAGTTATAGTGTTAPTSPTSGATTGATTAPATNTTSPASPVATLPGGGTDPVVVPPVPTVVAAVAILEDVRIGAHPETSSERIVFEFSGALPEARVEYVEKGQQCASGEDVPVEGSAVLQIRFLDAAAHDTNGQVTFGQQEVAGTGTPITEAKQYCDFENELGWVAGITGTQDFIVSTLADPPRIVVDVKQ